MGRKFIIIILLLFSVSSFPKDFTFCVLSDNCPGCSDCMQPEIFEKIIKKINAINPDFVIAIGDFIYGYINDENKLKIQFEEFKKATENLIPKIYYVPGNLDIGGSEIQLKLYQEYIQSELYYSFSFNDCIFIIINTEELGNECRIVNEQLLWLEKELAQNKDKRFKFIFGHRPLFPVGEHIGKSLDKFPDNQKEILALFNKYDVHYYICGYEHFYNKSKHNGLTQIISGGAGAPSRLESDRGNFYHFLLFKVSGNIITDKVIQVDMQSGYISWKKRTVDNKLFMEVIYRPDKDKFSEDSEIYLHWINNAKTKFALLKMIKKSQGFYIEFEVEPEFEHIIISFTDLKGNWDINESDWKIKIK